MRSLLTMLWIIIAGALAGCSGGGSSAEGVVGVKTDDTEMADAVQKAKNSIDGFVARFEKKDGDGFVIKFSVAAGKEKEFLWARVKTVTNDTFVVEVADTPVKSNSVKKNQILSLARSDVVDWAILKGKTIEGAYTDEVVKKHSKRR